MTAKSFLEGYAEFRDKVWEEDAHYRGFLASLKELNEETDRGTALVATSFLDTLLGDTIAAFLITNDSAKALLSGFNAPFGTLAARIASCHALGLITDAEAKQCDILRRVRNEFAHEIEVSFKTGKVRDICNNLMVPERDRDADPRRKFMTVLILLLIALLDRPHEAAKKRLSLGEWKSTIA
jgi:mannitol operon repressor